MEMTRKRCDNMDKCNAIEYADSQHCCVYLECQGPVPEPTSDVPIGNTDYHQGAPLDDYVAYAKGNFKFIDKYRFF